MGFGASESIWGRRLLPRVRQDLVLIANTIARYEPVTMLARPEDHVWLSGRLRDGVYLQAQSLDDLWLRDTGPAFVLRADGVPAAVDWHFNGWGRKQAHAHDQGVARAIAQSQALPIIDAGVVLEGGCFEVDGEGTAIITRSCVLNDNRNPVMSQQAFEQAFMPLLGLKKIIWLPGLRGQDITDGHTDFYVRFVRPGVVVVGLENDRDAPDYAVTRTHIRLLEQARDAQGRTLELHVLPAPRHYRRRWESDEFAAGYVGFYVCNGAVIMQKFGDQRADTLAHDVIAKLYPDRHVESLNVDGIAAGGGSIHCATQQQPRFAQPSLARSSSLGAS